jgi:hypothetical protein
VRYSTKANPRERPVSLCFLIHAIVENEPTYCQRLFSQGTLTPLANAGVSEHAVIRGVLGPFQSFILSSKTQLVIQNGSTHILPASTGPIVSNTDLRVSSVVSHARPPTKILRFDCLYMVIPGFSHTHPVRGFKRTFSFFSIFYGQPFLVSGSGKVNSKTYLVVPELVIVVTVTRLLRGWVACLMCLPLCALLL